MLPQSAPIRLVRIIARLNIGGPTIHVTLLTQKLSAPDYESYLVCGTVGEDEGDMAYYAQQHGVTPIYLPTLGRAIHPLRDLHTTWALWRLLRRIKPQVVHTHTMKAGFVGRLAARLAGVPVVVHTMHGHSFHGYWGPVKTRVFLWLERFAAALADRVVTLNEDLRHEIAEVYGVKRIDRVVALPLGLDLARFADYPRRAGNFRQTHNIASDAPLIGIVGRVVPIKNHALFLRAAALIHAQHPDARFVIVGDGELRPALEALATEMGLGDAVVFTGWVQDLRRVYSDLDVSVNSSRNEGTPVALIESMAAGVPVVATQVGGSAALLDDGALGRLVPDEDAAALAQSVLVALADPGDLPAIQQTILARYAIERLAADLDVLYRGLLHDKGRLSV